MSKLAETLDERAAIRAFTKQQRQWLTMCKRLTGFEPSIDPARSFYENAHTFLEWYVDWAHDMRYQLEREPAYQKAVEEKYR